MKTSSWRVLISGVAIAFLASGCASNSSSAQVARPHTSSNASDGFNPTIQSVQRTDASTSATSANDNIVGTSSTEGQFVLNFTVADVNRSVNFQTVQAPSEVGTDMETYNSRYQYILDSLCVDEGCTDVVVMLSQTDSSTNLSYQSVYVVNDSGNGYQTVTSKMGTSYDYIEDAEAALIDGPGLGS